MQTKEQRKVSAHKYYIKNREEILKVSKKHYTEYYKTHKEDYARRQREWNIKNKARATERRKKYRKANWAKIEDQRLMANFGIGLEEYNNMVLAQQNKCAICGNVPRGNKKLAVDHNHETGKIRGLLCHLCNNAIGLFGEDTSVLQNAIIYLVAHKELL